MSIQYSFFYHLYHAFYRFLLVTAPCLKGAVVIYEHKVYCIHTLDLRRAERLAREQCMPLPYVNRDIKQVNILLHHVVSHVMDDSHYIKEPDKS